MSYGRLVRDSATGRLNYDSATGHLIYRNWVEITAVSSWLKYGGNRMSDPDDFPPMEIVYPEAWERLQVSDWTSGVHLIARSSWGRWFPTGGPYYTIVDLLAGCIRFNVAPYYGRAVGKIRMSCTAYEKNTECDFRVSYRSDAETVPDPSWSWTASTPYLSVPGVGLGIYSLDPPLELDQSLWLTAWFSDFLPPSVWYKDNYLRIDTTARLYFTE